MCIGVAVVLVTVTAAPVIEYADALKETQAVKAGKSLTLSVNISGAPTPRAAWSRDGTEV